MNLGKNVTGQLVCVFTAGLQEGLGGEDQYGEASSCLSKITGWPKLSCSLISPHSLNRLCFIPSHHPTIVNWIILKNSPSEMLA